MEDRRQEAYRRAAASYVAGLRPYHGRATLIVAGRRAKESVLDDPNCGWAAYLPALEVHTLDAEHLGLLEDPHVESVARIFFEAMKPPTGA
jgi:thioesterase domain-containing protein